MRSKSAAGEEVQPTWSKALRFKSETRTGAFQGSFMNNGRDQQRPGQSSDPGDCATPRGTQFSTPNPPPRASNLTPDRGWNRRNTQVGLGVFPMPSPQQHQPRAPTVSAPPAPAHTPAHSHPKPTRQTPMQCNCAAPNRGGDGEQSRRRNVGRSGGRHSALSASSASSSGLCGTSWWRGGQPPLGGGRGSTLPQHNTAQSRIPSAPKALNENYKPKMGPLRTQTHRPPQPPMRFRGYPDSPGPHRPRELEPAVASVGMPNETKHRKIP